MTFTYPISPSQPAMPGWWVWPDHTAPPATRPTFPQQPRIFPDFPQEPQPLVFPPIYFIR